MTATQSRIAIALLVLIRCVALAQIDNRYCTDQGTWIGVSVDNPAIMDGAASLPTLCFNTDPKHTPSPGPVVTVNSSQSLQAAYNAAACGSTILLTHGGVWDDPFTFPAKNCDDDHWITIKSDGNLPPPGYRIAPSFAPEMAQLNIGRASGLVSIGDHLHFIGIHWQKNTKRGGILYFFAQMKGSNKVIFDRNYFHGNAQEETQHGVVVNTGTYIAVIDSWLDEFHCIAKIGACLDAQAVSGGTGDVNEDVMASGPVKIVNNFLEASTENILFGGSRANGPGPHDVEIRRNYLYKPLSWNPADPSYQGDPPYIVKNCFELKNGLRILFEGNICENVWGGFTQRGYAVLLTPMNQQGGASGQGLCPRCEVSDVTLRYNYIHTASGAFTISSGPNDSGVQYSMGQHRTSVHDNVVDNLQYGASCYGCGYNLMLMGSNFNPAAPPPAEGIMSDVAVTHNTILAAGKNPSTVNQQAYTLLLVNSVPPGVDTPQANNVSFQDNIASAMDAGIWSTGGTPASNCANPKPQTPVNIWKNCWVGNSPFTGNVLIEYPKPISNWPEQNLFSPSMMTVGFYDYANAVYALPQDSPYLGKGANMDVVRMAVFGVREEAREAPAKRPGSLHSRQKPVLDETTEEPMLTIHLILLILAMASFAAAALDVKFYRINLLPLGLFLWALAAVLMGR